MWWACVIPGNSGAESLCMSQSRMSDEENMKSRRTSRANRLEQSCQHFPDNLQAVAPSLKVLRN